MSSPDPPIAMTLRAEPGWRAILKKPLQRPPEPDDFPGEALYKLVVQPIRFWGFTIPVFSEYLRRKPVTPRVPAAMSSGSGVFDDLLSGVATLTSVEHLSKDDIVRPVPLGKRRKPFVHLIDIIDPRETDAQALSRVEEVFEAERVSKRLHQVLFVMES